MRGVASVSHDALGQAPWPDAREPTSPWVRRGACCERQPHDRPACSRSTASRRTSSHRRLMVTSPTTVFGSGGGRPSRLRRGGRLPLVSSVRRSSTRRSRLARAVRARIATGGADARSSPLASSWGRTAPCRRRAARWGARRRAAAAGPSAAAASRSRWGRRATSPRRRRPRGLLVVRARRRVATCR